MANFRRLIFLLGYFILGIGWGENQDIGIAFGQGVVNKVCSRIEGLFIPCGGGGGGCGCPTKISCDTPSFDYTCTSSYDGSPITQSCPTCCFEDKCDAIKDSMECTKTVAICGQVCKGTKDRTSCSGTCTNYKEKSYTVAVTKTTSECLESRQVETFSCASAGSSDGCNCSCRQGSTSCQVSSTGTCSTGQCSCGKVGVMQTTVCTKYKKVCDRVDTVPCRVPDQSVGQVPGSNCSCNCPPDFVQSPPEVLKLPFCGTNTSCTVGECLNCN